ncbi:MAG: hypothetical protein E3J65_00745 [Dehalococcoidia bacterium]|nr:MAG: hypothetical protein E3J65_00745 [Dehalococcoidia bacterium]
MLGIKVRQPLQKVIIKVRSKGEREGVERVKAQVLEELNVKDIKLVTQVRQFMTVEVESNRDLKAPENEGHLRDVLKELTYFNEDDIDFKVAGDQNEPFQWSVTRREDKPGYFSVESTRQGGYLLILATQITPELADEGMARELVHRLQTMRKQAGFDIADHILTYYQGGASIQRVIREFAPYIKQETLSRDLIEGVPKDAYTESHRIDGEEVVLGVLR